MMTFLVQDFLDYAQIKSGKFRVNLKQFNILETVENVISIQRQKAIDSGIKLEMENANIDTSVPQRPNGALIQKTTKTMSPLVITDEARVMQVLLNLQSNALKFTRVGKVRVRVGIKDEREGQFL